jgi:hypothetical protein
MIWWSKDFLAPGDARQQHEVKELMFEKNTDLKERQ